MNILKTTYSYEGSDKFYIEEADLDIIKQWSLQEIRMVCVMNFMMPIDPIPEFSYDDEVINPKRFVLKYEDVSSLFVTKRIFYDTIKKLTDKGVIKRDIRNTYIANPKYFHPAENGGTCINIFQEFNNHPM